MTDVDAELDQLEDEKQEAGAQGLDGYDPFGNLKKTHGDDDPDADDDSVKGGEDEKHNR